MTTLDMSFHDWIFAFTKLLGPTRAVDLRNRDDIAHYFVRNPEDDMARYYSGRYHRRMQERARRQARTVQ